jgi:hypothetical protein
MGLDIGDDIFNYLIASTNIGGASAGILGLSVLGNYYQYRKIKEYSEDFKKFENLFTILEPILTKIINNQKLSSSDIDDIKKVREIIKFKSLK